MQVKKLSLFPFKSLKGIDLDEAEVDAHGFKYDRIYMLVYKRPNGVWTVLTQREETSMARVSEKLVGSNLELSVESGAQITLPLDYSVLEPLNDNIELSLWGEKLVCKDIATTEVKQFFIDFFDDSKYNLDNLSVVVPLSRRDLPKDQEHTRKFLENEKEVKASFQDIWPVTLMTTASFKEIESQVQFMDEDAKISKDSFRMNIYVETDEPWIEDDWKLIKIGGHEYVVDAPLERCPIPAIDQDSGTFRDKKHPLPSLNRYRVLEKGRTPCFGVNMINKDANYTIRVGDKVEVLDQQPYL